MKNAFVAFELNRDAAGKLMTDADGCCSLKPHTHKLLAGKEFCHQGEVIQAIRDYNAPKQDPGNPSVMVSPSDRFIGEVIVLNVLTF
jgi:hypothetical protein